MKFKLDENFGAGLQSGFLKSGHNVETAASENLSGTTDEHIFEICCSEGRCLITLDLDFSDPVRFHSRLCGGIVIFRMPRRFSMRLFESMIDRFLQELDVLGLKGDLWIVEPGRISVHKTDEDA